MGCRLMVCGLVFLGMGWASPAAADWESGQLTEHDGPWTLNPGQVRLSLLGRSAVGLSDRVELSTFLPLDLVLFPNLSLKWRIVDGPVSLAWKGGVGGGLLPVGGSGILPSPVPLAAGGIGIVAGSIQTTSLDLGWGPGALSLLARVGVYRAELGGAGVGAVVGPGALGVAGGSAGTHSSGLSASAEIARTLGTNNAIFARTEVLSRVPMANDTGGLLIADVGWLHAWRHTHLMVGAYALYDVPLGLMWQEPASPIGPMVNLSWTWGGHPAPTTSHS